MPEYYYFGPDALRWAVSSYATNNNTRVSDRGVEGVNKEATILEEIEKKMRDIGKGVLEGDVGKAGKEKGAV